MEIYLHQNHRLQSIRTTNSVSLCYQSSDLALCVLQGRYAGNAVGFKISSLLKLIETRANKPRMTLLHYLVDEAEKTDKHVLQFADDLKQPLTAANRSVAFALARVIYFCV